ncbi:MAG: hypothetical protein HY877_06840 [Deltaproteobacteria bacterium]|nr:hypothetical protein [Deltaproteobacteria bacterium]
MRFFVANAPQNDFGDKPNNKGGVVVEYVLVVALLAFWLAAAFYNPGHGGRSVGASFLAWHHDLSERVAKP